MFTIVLQLFYKYTNSLQTTKCFANFFANFFVKILFITDTQKVMFNKNLIEVVNTLGFENPVTQIATDLVFSKGTISSYLNGKLKASKPFLEKFAKFYKIPIEKITNKNEIDGDVIGKGNSEIIISPTSNFKTKNVDLLVPFYDIDFAAGNDLILVDNSKVQPDYYMDVPEFSGCTAFRAYSDSMENLIKSGNILFGTKVEEWQLHLEYGQIYGIICNDGRRYLKYIRKFIENPKDFFLLKSENIHYDDFEIPKHAIRSIWLIHGWLNKRT